jgi:hypothetical protein
VQTTFKINGIERYVAAKAGLCFPSSEEDSAKLTIIDGLPVNETLSAQASLSELEVAWAYLESSIEYNTSELILEFNTDMFTFHLPETFGETEARTSIDFEFTVSDTIWYRAKYNGSRHILLDNNSITPNGIIAAGDHSITASWFTGCANSLISQSLLFEFLPSPNKIFNIIVGETTAELIPEPAI